MNFLQFRPLTEIDFLSRQTKSFAVGNRNSSGVMCTITPVSDSTFVLVGALLTISANSSILTTVTLNLEIDGIIVEQYVLKIAFSGGNIIPVNFVSKGQTLDGDGVKVIEFNITTSNTQNVSGTIYGYLRNT